MKQNPFEFDVGRSSQDPESCQCLFVEVGEVGIPWIRRVLMPRLAEPGTFSDNVIKYNYGSSSGDGRAEC